jgi:hypothetical protein
MHFNLANELARWLKRQKSRKRNCCVHSVFFAEREREMARTLEEFVKQNFKSHESSTLEALRQVGVTNWEEFLGVSPAIVVPRIFKRKVYERALEIAFECETPKPSRGPPAPSKSSSSSATTASTQSVSTTASASSTIPPATLRSIELSSCKSSGKRLKLTKLLKAIVEELNRGGGCEIQASWKSSTKLSFDDFKKAFRPKLMSFSPKLELSSNPSAALINELSLSQVSTNAVRVAIPVNTTKLFVYAPIHVRKDSENMPDSIEDLELAFKNFPFCEGLLLKKQSHSNVSDNLDNCEAARTFLQQHSGSHLTAHSTCPPEDVHLEYKLLSAIPLRVDDACRKVIKDSYFLTHIRSSKSGIIAFGVHDKSRRAFGQVLSCEPEEFKSSLRQKLVAFCDTIFPTVPPSHIFVECVEVDSSADEAALENAPILKINTGKATSIFMNRCAKSDMPAIFCGLDEDTLGNDVLEDALVDDDAEESEDSEDDDDDSSDAASTQARAGLWRSEMEYHAATRINSRVTSVVKRFIVIVGVDHLHPVNEQLRKYHFSTRRGWYCPISVEAQHNQAPVKLSPADYWLRTKTKSNWCRTRFEQYDTILVAVAAMKLTEPLPPELAHIAIHAHLDLDQDNFTLSQLLLTHMVNIIIWQPEDMDPGVLFGKLTTNLAPFEIVQAVIVSKNVAKSFALATFLADNISTAVLDIVYERPTIAQPYLKGLVLMKPSSSTIPIPPSYAHLFKMYIELGKLDSHILPYLVVSPTQKRNLIQAIRSCSWGSLTTFEVGAFFAASGVRTLMWSVAHYLSNEAPDCHVLVPTDLSKVEFTEDSLLQLCKHYTGSRIVVFFTKPEHEVSRNLSARVPPSCSLVFVTQHPASIVLPKKCMAISPLVEHDQIPALMNSLSSVYDSQDAKNALDALRTQLQTVKQGDTDRSVRNLRHIANFTLTAIRKSFSTIETFVDSVISQCDSNTLNVLLIKSFHPTANISWDSVLKSPAHAFFLGDQHSFINQWIPLQVLQTLGARQQNMSSVMYDYMNTSAKRIFRHEDFTSLLKSEPAHSNFHINALMGKELSRLVEVVRGENKVSLRELIRMRDMLRLSSLAHDDEQSRLVAKVAIDAIEQKFKDTQALITTIELILAFEQLFEVLPNFLSVPDVCTTLCEILVDRPADSNFSPFLSLLPYDSYQALWSIIEANWPTVFPARSAPALRVHAHIHLMISRMARFSDCGSDALTHAGDALKEALMLRGEPDYPFRNNIAQAHVKCAMESTQPQQQLSHLESANAIFQQLYDNDRNAENQRRTKMQAFNAFDMALRQRIPNKYRENWL